MCDAIVVFEILAQDEEVLRVQLSVLEQQLGQLVGLDVVQRHEATIDGETFYLVLENKLG
jgi:hypothetical protein